MATDQNANLDSNAGSAEQTGTQAMPENKAQEQIDKLTIIAARRKFWIEWECHLSKNPDEKGLEELRKYLLNYIATYLDGLAIYYEPEKKLIEEIRQRDKNFQKIISEVEQENKILFAPRNGYLRNMPEDALEVLRFEKWDSQLLKWLLIKGDEYSKIVLQNEKPGSTKVGLKFTPYTRKWMNILQTNWERVSEAYPIFSFQGWFLTHKNVRLTNAGSENRGSMNPPPPPPPPQ